MAECQHEHTHQTCGKKKKKTMVIIPLYQCRYHSQHCYHYHCPHNPSAVHSSTVQPWPAAAAWMLSPNQWTSRNPLVNFSDRCGDFRILGRCNGWYFCDPDHPCSHPASHSTAHPIMAVDKDWTKDSQSSTEWPHQEWKSYRIATHSNLSTDWPTRYFSHESSTPWNCRFW